MLFENFASLARGATLAFNQLKRTRKENIVAISVRIIKGVHTINIPHGMNKLLKEMLQKAGFEQGEFKILLGERIKGKNHTKGIRLVRFDETRNSFILKVQPDSNDSRHVCTINLPELYRKEAANHFEKLQSIYEVVTETEVEENESAESNTKTSPPEATSQVIEEIKPIPIAPARIMIPDKEMFACIITEILQFGGKGYLSSRRLFEIVRKLKLEIAEDKLVGMLLRHGYLEPNEDKGKKISRISASGYDLMEAYSGKHNYELMETYNGKRPPSESMSVSEEQQKFNTIRILAEKHQALKNQTKPFIEEIAGIENKISEMKTQIEKTRILISEIEKQITPEMEAALLATQQIQILLSKF